jgi:hypothetical protein
MAAKTPRPAREIKERAAEKFLLARWKQPQKAVQRASNN